MVPLKVNFTLRTPLTVMALVAGTVAGAEEVEAVVVAGAVAGAVEVAAEPESAVVVGAVVGAVAGAVEVSCAEESAGQASVTAAVRSQCAERRRAEW